MNRLSIDALPNSTTIATVPVRQISGRYLAKARIRLDPRGRAELAAAIVAGRVEITDLTIKQIANLCKANATYLNEVRFPDRAKRVQQKKLARVFDAIGADARAELCRTIGVERVWAALAAALD